jgi:hypothetical protein
MNPTHQPRSGEPSSDQDKDKEEQPIQFAGSALKAKRHICAFFRSQEEEYRILLPFIKEGIERGEKAFHVVDPELRDDHLQRLKDAGIDTDSAEQAGQLQLKVWDEVYFHEGRFDQQRRLTAWKDVFGDTERGRLPRTRIVAHMEWALKDCEGVEDLVEYEARFSMLYEDPPDPVICTYDLNKFSADVIMNILRAHPTVIVGGLLQENPFYIPPEQFLEELRERRTVCA